MNTGMHPVLKQPYVSIGPGEHYATNTDDVISTVLGSCVAVGIFDPDLKAGGLNHFMLPDEPLNKNLSATESGRYGLKAMELLLGDLVKLGSRRRRLEAKVFGGGAFIATEEVGWRIALRNVEFAFEFLSAEGITVVSSDVGGASARRILYFPKAGRALVKATPWTGWQLAHDEAAYSQSIARTDHKHGSVTLFEGETVPGGVA